MSHFGKQEHSQSKFTEMWEFFVVLLFFAIGMFMNLAYVVRYWKYVGNLEHSSMLTLILIPFVCIAIQVRFYGASLVNLGITVALLFLFMTCLITRLNNLANEARKTAELKMKLAEQKEEMEFVKNYLYLEKKRFGKKLQLAVSEYGIENGYQG